MPRPVNGKGRETMSAFSFSVIVIISIIVLVDNASMRCAERGK